MAPTERRRRPALYRVRIAAGAIEPRATVGSGDAFLAGFVAARYSGRAADGVPALRRRLRRRVDAALRRRASSIPRGSSGCSPTVEVERLASCRPKLG